MKSSEPDGAGVASAAPALDLSRTQVVNGNALDLPLPDASVDLIVTSPPYFALRSYRDGDEHYDGQIGSEATPQEFLEALWAATREMIRVLKPTGSIWVNLGDKYAGSGGHNNAGVSDKSTLKNDGRKNPRPVTERELALREMSASRRNAPDRYNQSATVEIGRRIDKGEQRYVRGDVPKKSLMGLPWRYALGCVDQLGLILRAEVIWSKPNGLPESVTDRVRRSHEQWFHFVKQGRYFAAVDEVREPHVRLWDPATNGKGPDFGGNLDKRNDAITQTGHRGTPAGPNPLGKLPGSVWTIPSEPLLIPEAVQQHYQLPDHFAAFPTEWPRRIILGWSPSGICTACGEGRRPVVEKTLVGGTPFSGRDYRRLANGPNGGPERPMPGGHNEATITGYACACPDTTAPTRPAVVLDPFGGTGTVAMVARALGRVGISVDLSTDYCRLAEWRIFQSGHAAKAEDRTWADRQRTIFDD